MMEPALAAGLGGVGAAAGAVAVGITRRRRPREASSFVRFAHRLWWAPVAAAAIVVPSLAPVAVAGGLLWVTGRRVVARRAAGARRRDADREIPQLLDLLAAAASAGLSAVAGFRAAVGTLRGPLGDELRAALHAVDLGGRWRDELAVVIARLELPELRRAIAILDRSATLGTSLVDATRELAEDVRRARRAAVAERARSAPVKMLFPLVFLILPAFLLLTVVPVLLTTVRSIG
jgi:tight adherence protein C